MGDDGSPGRCRAPGRPTLSILAAVLVAAILAACHDPPESSSDPDLRRELELPDHAVLHRVNLSVAGDRVRMLPLRTRIGAGDAVQFVALDHRVHLVRFRAGEMDEEALAFLQRTNQDRPPPLIEREAPLVLTFRGAPPGVYPFDVQSSGATARGEIVVGSR